MNNIDNGDYGTGWKTHEKNEKKPNYMLRRLGAAALIGFTLFLGALILREPVAAKLDKIENPLQFDGEQDWIAGQGQGLNDAAAHVEGVGSVDIRDVTYHIEQTNKKELSDGLQVGESLTIPKNVTKR